MLEKRDRNSEEAHSILSENDGVFSKGVPEREGIGSEISTRSENQSLELSSIRIPQGLA